MRSSSKKAKPILRIPRHQPTDRVASHQHAESRIIDFEAAVKRLQDQRHSDHADSFEFEDDLPPAA